MTQPTPENLETTDELQPEAPDPENRCPTCWEWDPLRDMRSDDDPGLDVLLSGTVFFDLIFSGLPRLPEPGEELWSEGMGSSPGGIANLATATARLGLRTGLVAGFGDDAMADWMWNTLESRERINLASSRRFSNFHSPITVAASTHGDRAMVTHGHVLPEPLDPMIAQAPSARAALVDLAGETGWWKSLTTRGTKIWADIGFDPTEKWDPADLAPLEHCYAFTPNSVEAMHYTRTDTPSKAVRALADKVGLAIVTDGANGVYAIDQYTGEEAYCPALTVPAVDPTGAGDVFGAASVIGALAQWPLMQRLRFASLCSAIAVQRYGGALAAPTWGDIALWWRTLTDQVNDGDLESSYVREHYAFLDDLVPTHEVRHVAHAEATFHSIHAPVLGRTDTEEGRTPLIRVDNA